MKHSTALPVAWVTLRILIILNWLGGAAILLGVYARQVSLGLTPVMAVAASVHFGNGWLFTNKGGGWEYPVFLVFASVALWLAGDGALALRRSQRFVPALA